MYHDFQFQAQCASEGRTGNSAEILFPNHLSPTTQFLGKAGYTNISDWLIRKNWEQSKKKGKFSVVWAFMRDGHGGQHILYQNLPDYIGV